MALTITTTADPYSYVMRLYVAGGTPPYTVSAQPSGGRPAYTVRSPQTTVSGDATARNLVDGQIPLGTVATIYRVTDAAGATVDSAAVSIPAALPVLSDALDPGRFVTLTVVSQKPNHWAPRTVWFDVLGRRDPTVAIGPMRLRDGTLVLRYGADVTRRQVIDLLTPGDPMLLRTPCPNAVDDVTFVVTDLAESLALEDAPAGPTVFTLTYQGVTGDLGPFTGDPSRTYATVAGESTQYAELPLKFVDYASLAAGLAFTNQGPQLIPHGWATGADYAAGWNYGWSSGAPGSSSGGVGLIVSSGTLGSRWIAIYQPDVYNYVTTAGKKYRITFQARQATGAAGATAYVEAITNTAPASADYFQPGAIQAGSGVSAVTLDGQWRTCTYDVTIPAGDDRLTVSFNVRNMPAGAATYEVRNPSVRELT